MEILSNILTNLPSIAVSSISQGLLWSLLAIGVFITYRILDVADLTTEGTFPLGGAIAATAIVNGLSPVIGTLLGFGGGMLAGLISGLLHTKLKIPALLAGIITMTGLYSINSRIMGKPNVSLLGEERLFSSFEALGFNKENAVIFVGLIIVAIVIVTLYVFFRTEIGLSIVATGDNLEMSEANGINTHTTKILGYMISNGCIALSGALLAQNNGFADLNAGVGTIVIGLASIIISEVLFASQPLFFRMCSIVLGAIIYRFILAIILEFPIEANDNKLFSALILILCLSLPLIKKKMRRKNGKGAPAK
ncbi:ABC transporter permease [Vagococcus sp. BWB3-3]|uniref:ABC transporter permease n=1 Tax=Vagococcus allomyrinae TaxID=2794353 RepID=A0A940P4B7_9ENTE|nr:ABC transporter permease [Vagococcus allomyrinae]MBP1041314.1 ABC transporter permease [Vagococcus allomyrinae]